jgi:hypothetical protein
MRKLVLSVTTLLIVLKQGHSCFITDCPPMYADHVVSYSEVSYTPHAEGLVNPKVRAKIPLPTFFKT